MDNKIADLPGIMETTRAIIEPLLPVLITLCIAVALLYAADRLFMQRMAASVSTRLPRQLVMIGLTLCAALALVLSLPVSDGFRADLLGLLGVVLTALVAFSSTTFVANMMAGLMLRSVKSYNLGDFIEAGTFFGKVTERGLFHTEIQSEDRDLITLPNLYLATNPVKVVKSSGTAINCVISLGYDADRLAVEKALKSAGESCELEEPFVQILELGDYAVTYKAAGFYRDIRHLLSKKSEFKGAILDALHGAGIEIVSPAFMNQRALDPDKPVIARVSESEATAGDLFPEALLFDKADRAQRIQMLEDKHAALKEELKVLKKESPDSDAEIRRLESRLAMSETLLQQELDRKENDPDS